MAKNNKGGRPEKYTTHILPFLSQIEQWWINKNTNVWIADQLGVSVQFFQKCLAEKKELKELYDKIPYLRVSIVEDLKKALIERAKGFEYEEEKIYIEANEDGTTKKRKEIFKRKAIPDVTAIDKALNIYDDEYIPNKANYKLKQKELDMKIEAAKREMECWEVVEGDNE